MTSSAMHAQCQRDYSSAGTCPLLFSSTAGLSSRPDLPFCFLLSSTTFLFFARTHKKRDPSQVHFTGVALSTAWPSWLLNASIKSGSFHWRGLQPLYTESPGELCYIIASVTYQHGAGSEPWRGSLSLCVMQPSTQLLFQPELYRFFFYCYLIKVAPPTPLLTITNNRNVSIETL